MRKRDELTDLARQKEQASLAEGLRREVVELQVELSAAREDVMHLSALDTTDWQNVGASQAARALLAIARYGRESGVFGGRDLEEAAGAILVLREALVECQRRCEGLAQRVAAQSELLTRRAEGAS